MKEIAFLNGAFIPLAEAKIAVADYGFLFGYGLFETMRAYDGRVFRLDCHLERLGRSAKRLGIRVDVAGLEGIVAETVRKNGLKEARVRVTVSAGAGSLTPDPGSCKTPTILITALKYIPHSTEIYCRGWKVILSSFTRPTRSPLTTMKTANYLESILARQEARDFNADDAILLNDRGMAAEATSSNLFLVSQGILKTPGLESGILPGITREVVLELALDLGITTVETDISPGELMAAEEVFATNSLIEIMPVTMIDGRTIGNGKIGAITNSLIMAYRGLVHKETGALLTKRSSSL